MSIATDRELSEGPTTRGDVAIIGMACVFPGAPDLQTYWQNILSKKDAVIDVPRGRWDAETYFSKDADDINKVYCKRGGYLDEFMSFDPVKYGVMPLGLEGGEPDQFLVLKVVHEALKDAGCLDRTVDSRRTEFILGRGNYLGSGASNLIQRSVVTEQTLKILKSLHPEYSKEELAEIRRELLGCLPKFSADSAPAFIPNLTTGRVANRMDFMGANFTVDAACASSLIATEIGVGDLLTGKCDLALAGGVHIFANVPFLLIFCAFQAMSLRSQIRPFDKDADGTLPGEGAGVVVLKRLKDAERDGDRIYAVIKGVGVASDGRAVSVTAPRLEGEELALRRAYEIAGCSPRTIRLIEAHGVGTTVGDVVEVQSMSRVFGQREESGPRCALGTIKSMIGHAMPAAGVAGLIKTAMSLYHKVLPATIHCETVNPKLEIEKTPFYLNTETRPWIHAEKEFPRRAGLNAFGFGGINAHAVLEEYVSQEAGVPGTGAPGTGAPGTGVPGRRQESTPQFWETEVCIFYGESRQKLVQQICDLQKFLGQYPQTLLRDLAYSLNMKMGQARLVQARLVNESCNQANLRLAVVASSVDDLQQKLAYARQRLSDPDCRQIKDLKGIYFFESPLSREGKLAFLFPGEGSQYVNMLADLCIYFPEVRSCFDRTDQILLEQGREDLPSFNIFAPPFFSEEERLAAENRLWKMDRATEAVLTGNLAMYTLLTSLGIKPDQMVGHSAGEWSAMVFSGIIDAEEFLHNTGKLNQIYRTLSLDPDIPKATLIAAGTSLSQISSITEHIDGTIYLANDNCPHQVVIIGEEKVAEEVVGYLRAKSIPFEKLPFDRGYHTPLFASICPHLREYFSSFSLSAPKTDIYSCTTMSPYPEEPEKILELAVKTWVLPVAFRQTIENMYNSGTRLFIEVGPRGNLTAFVEDILRGKPHLAVPSNVMRRSGITQLNHLVGLLSAQGISLNLGHLYQYRSPQYVSWTDKEDRGVQTRPVEARGVEIKLPLGLYSLTVKERPVSPLAAKKADLMIREPADIKRETVKGVNDGNSCPGPEDYTSAWAEPAFTSDGSSDRCAHSDISPRLDSRPQARLVAGTPVSPSVMQQYFHTMSHFLDTQKEMMQAYLERGTSGRGKQDMAFSELLGTQANLEQAYPGDGASPEDVESLPAPLSSLPDPPAPSSGKERPMEDDSARQAHQGQARLVDEDSAKQANLAQANLAQAGLVDERSEQPSGMSEEDLTRIMLDLVSEKTGYPPEMIDLDLDMEGDLGIDSIKRVEIIGSFNSQYAKLGEEDVETISGLKTIRQVIDLLKKKMTVTPEDKAPETQANPAQANPAQANLAQANPIQTHPVEEKREDPSLVLPFVGTIVDLKPGKSVVVLRQVDLQEDLFLYDHRFGQKISELDPSLGGLPVIPMTVSIEIMAEVASLLFPGQKLIRVEKIVARQWICLLGDKKTTLRIKAEVSAKGEAMVQIQNLEKEGSLSSPDQKPVITGRTFFANSYSSPPPLQEFILQEERDPSHTAEQVYSEHRMFHGPAFQGIASMDKVGKNGLKAQLQTLSANNLFKSNQGPEFLLDPFLLDAAGQLVGYWPVEYLDSGFVIFPIALESLDVYGPSPAPSSRYQVRLFHTRMRLREITNTQVRADLEILREDGQLWMKLTGWEDWRFYWSRELYDFWRFPNRGFIGQLWEHDVTGEGPGTDVSGTAVSGTAVSGTGIPAAGTLGIGVTCSLLQQFWRGEADVFKHVMAYMVLSRQEREVYHSLSVPGEPVPGEPVPGMPVPGTAAGKGQGAWLLEKMAAKDAVRSVLQKHGQKHFYPADISIIDDEQGVPKWARPVGENSRLVLDWAPGVSLAHTDDAVIAVAATGLPSEGLAVGIRRIRQPGAPVAGAPVAGAPVPGAPVPETSAQEEANLTEVPGNRPAWLPGLHSEEEALLSGLLSGLDKSKARLVAAVRMLCAKEALAKALGRSLDTLVIREFDVQTGRVKVSLGETGAPGKLESSQQPGAPVPGAPVIQVYTFQENEYVIAITIF